MDCQRHHAKFQQGPLTSTGLRLQVTIKLKKKRFVPTEGISSSPDRSQTAIAELDISQSFYHSTPTARLLRMKQRISKRGTTLLSAHNVQKNRNADVFQSNSTTPDENAIPDKVNELTRLHQRKGSNLSIRLEDRSQAYQASVSAAPPFEEN